MAVPYTFGSATTSIPLSQLDSNFATTITLGNTAVQLGNTITNLTGVSNVASATSLSLGTSGNTTAVTIDTGQNVGIGTASPSNPLHVVGSIRTSSGSNYAQFSNNFLRSNASGSFFYDNATVGQSNEFRTSVSSSLDTTALTLTASGILALRNAATNATGIGITFPATQSASSDANTLDDYEEGTFTPVIYAGGSQPTGASIVALGTYTKIGRMVSYIVDIGMTTIGTGSGSVQIRGMPFTVSSGVNAYACPAAESENLVSALTGFLPLLPPNTTYFDVYYNWNGTSGPTQLQYSGCKNGTGFRLTGLYFTT